MKTRRTSKSGFTLVEITLAILVVGIGLLAAYALFPSGLRMNKNAIDETEAAFFAQEVFAGLHAKIDHDPVAWANPGKVVLEAVIYGMWDGSTVKSLEVKQSVGNTFSVLIYRQWYSAIIERTIRYNLRFNNPGAGRVLTAELQVGMGERGTNVTGRFYTQFYKTGMLWP